MADSLFGFYGSEHRDELPIGTCTPPPKPHPTPALSTVPYKPYVASVDVKQHVGFFHVGSGGKGCLSFRTVLCVGCLGGTVLCVCLEYHI